MSNVRTALSLSSPFPYLLFESAMRADKNQQVYIVGDDTDIRQALEMLFQTNNIPATSFENTATCLTALTPESNGCMILDIQMPGTSGLALQKTLNENNFNVEIIFISGVSDVAIAVEAMKGGALEFLQKPFSDKQLLTCVYQALEINYQKMQKRRSKEAIEHRIGSLSKREYEVMNRMLNGDITKVIAADLGISPRTAEIHRHNVMEKMQVKTLAQLVHLVLKARYV